MGGGGGGGGLKKIKRGGTLIKEPRVLIKTFNDLTRHETTYNEQETTSKYLKWPTTSTKRIQMTYNEKETNWNNLQQERNNLQWPETT